MLLTNTQVSKLRKAFANGSSANIKLSKSQLHKIGQSGVFLGWLLGPLLKNELPLMKNAFKPLAKSVLIPFRLTAVIATTDAAIQHKMSGSDLPRMLASRTPDLASRTTILRISNHKINDILKIAKSLEESHLLVKDVSETV